MVLSEGNEVNNNHMAGSLKEPDSLTKQDKGTINIAATVNKNIKSRQNSNDQRATNSANEVHANSIPLTSKEVRVADERGQETGHNGSKTTRIDGKQETTHNRHSLQGMKKAFKQILLQDRSY